MTEETVESENEKTGAFHAKKPESKFPRNLCFGFASVAPAPQRHTELAIARCDMSESKKHSFRFFFMFAALLFCFFRASPAPLLRRELIMQITFARIDVVKAKTTHVHLSWMLAGEQSGNFHFPCEVD